MDFEIFEHVQSPKVEKSVSARRSGYIISELSFKSQIETPFTENNTVYAYQYEYERIRKPMAVIVIHGLGVPCLLLERSLCAILDSKGFVASAVILPYHMKRAPDGLRSGAYFLSTDLQRTGMAYRQAVIDIRCLVDWYASQGFTIALVGTSLGAILLHTLMGIDKRIAAGVSILGGGNINKIIWQGLIGLKIRRTLQRQGITKNEYKETLREYKEYLHRISTQKEIPLPKWNWFLLDPLTYAYNNHPRCVLMINGLFDMVIPRSCVKELHDIIDGFPIIWLPCSHFGAYLFVPYIFYQTVHFLSRINHLQNCHTSKVSHENIKKVD